MANNAPATPSLPETREPPRDLARRPAACTSTLESRINAIVLRLVAALRSHDDNDATLAIEALLDEGHTLRAIARRCRGHLSPTLADKLDNLAKDARV